MVTGTGGSDGWVPTPRFVEQAARVAELLQAGYSNRRIAEVMRVSPPRISQIRQRLPDLEPYLTPPDPLAGLRDRRTQLLALRRQALALATAVRRDLRDLDEELEAVEIDRILGLRP